MRMRTRITRAVGLLLLIYAVMVLLVAGCQRQMIYYPQRGDEPTLTRQAAAAGLQPWSGAGGDRIGWQRAPEAAEPEAAAVLVIHGNAGHAGHRGYYADALGDPRNTGGEGWHVYLLEYPGYGSRPGQPTERSLKKAAEQALAQLNDQHPRVVIVGESLGTGVATHLAGKRPEQVDALLLISPFPSLVDVGRSHFPWLPVSWLLRDRYDSQGPLSGYPGPVAVVIAESDEVIPPRLSQRLFDDYQGTKRRWVQPGRGHNTMDLSRQAPWWGEVTGFWRESWR